MPVCSRCLGIILGLPVGLLAGCFGHFVSRWYGVFFWIPLLIDFGSQEAGCRDSNNFLRILTGYLAGIGLGLFLLLWILEDLRLLRRIL